MNRNIEKYISTPEYIKEQLDINVISIKKYFPHLFRAKQVIISGAYIIFNMSMANATRYAYVKYISSSRDILNQINLYKTENMLVAYIYEIDYNRLEEQI